MLSQMRPSEPRGPGSQVLIILQGKQKVMYALTKIKGVGRRYSNLVCKKADVDLNKRYELLI
jgi:ribosomal protein S13